MEMSEETEQKTQSPGKKTFTGTASTAHTVLSGAQTWFSRVGQTTKDAAIAAGQRIDKAAISMGAAVDQYSQQVQKLLPIGMVTFIDS
jgi:hypothetical protein